MSEGGFGDKQLDLPRTFCPRLDFGDAVFLRRRHDDLAIKASLAGHLKPH